MIRKIGILTAKIGAHVLENHGFWIDRGKNLSQDNYEELPLLGKIGYNCMMLGLKIAKIDVVESLNSLAQEES